MNYDLLYTLREDVQFRRFPDSGVAFHPDTGDTLVVDNTCGIILQVLHEARKPLGTAEIDQITCALNASLSNIDQSVIANCLAALEIHDLIRTITP